MTTTACDTEICEICRQPTVEGNDELGRCVHCTHSSLDRLLRSMAAGVTRDPRTGRFTSTRKA